MAPHPMAEMPDRQTPRIPLEPRILLVRPSALGDVCRTVPLLTSLRKAFPDATIDWLVQDSFAAAVEAHPDLDQVVAFPRREFSAIWKPSVAMKALRWIDGIRRARYDIVIDAQGLGRSGLITRLSGARRRVGFADARECGWLGYNARVRSESIHTVDRMLDLLSAIDVEPLIDMRLHLREADRTWWSARRDALAPAVPYVVVAPASRWPGKCWPAPHWQVLIKRLVERGVEHVVAIGAANEQAAVRAALPGDRLDATVSELTGQTSIGQTMAIIAGASLVVASDSAPLHMAVGFNRPIVGLYGATNPDKVGPYAVADGVVRPSAVSSDEVAAVHFKDARRAAALMAAIPPDEVVATVDRVLATRPLESIR